MEEEIKCAICDGGFVEEMTGEGVDTATDPESNTYLSLWASFFSEMLDSDDDDHEEEEEGVMLGRRRRISAINRLLQDVLDDAENEREPIIFINNAILVQGSPDTNQSQGQSSVDGGTGVPLPDFLGLALDLVLRRPEETDPNRHGTPPAQKAAVEAMPTVKIEESLSCLVCLEDFDISAEAREMPCKHKFHAGCILPWLELHSSCPICRFQMPTEESTCSSAGGNGDGVGVHHGSGNDSGGGDERRSRLPATGPFSGLLSLLRSHRSGDSSSSQPSSSSTRSNS
ncbi:E3 ubiquitin-protein ligase [Musa troglodytarum]|nr:E3 ubiquitin-protein ligase [Musa troglodytarum]